MNMIDNNESQRREGWKRASGEAQQDPHFWGEGQRGAK